MHTKPSYLWNVLVKSLSTLGVGYIPYAPGTWGSLFGLLVYIYLHNHFFAEYGVWVMSVLILIAVYICGEAEKIMKIQDPSCVVLDEAVVMPVCFWGVHYPVSEWIMWVMGFIVFRFFDITKCLGIRKIQSLKGGWGIVMDDFVAAVLTNLLLQVIGECF